MERKVHEYVLFDTATTVLEYCEALISIVFGAPEQNREAAVS